MHYSIYETEEYLNWFGSQTFKSASQIQNRITKIEQEGYFGNAKFLNSAGIWELKFNDGRRIYYVIVPKYKVVLLLGGNKNGQDKDIRQASNILRKLG